MALPFSFTIWIVGNVILFDSVYDEVRLVDYIHGAMKKVIHSCFMAFQSIKDILLFAPLKSMINYDKTYMKIAQPVKLVQIWDIYWISLCNNLYADLCMPWTPHGTKYTDLYDLLPPALRQPENAVFCVRYSATWKWCIMGEYTFARIAPTGHTWRANFQTSDYIDILGNIRLWKVRVSKYGISPRLANELRPSFRFSRIPTRYCNPWIPNLRRTGKEHC